MHFLLMHGADPKAFDDIEEIGSVGILKLLVEFGYDIRPTSHLKVLRPMIHFPGDYGTSLVCAVWLAG